MRRSKTGDRSIAPSEDVLARLRRSAAHLRNQMPRPERTYRPIKSGGELEASFKEIREACINLIRAAGKNSDKFRDDPAYFAACLQALRDAVIREVG